MSECFFFLLKITIYGLNRQDESFLCWQIKLIIRSWTSNRPIQSFHRHWHVKYYTVWLIIFISCHLHFKYKETARLTFTSLFKLHAIYLFEISYCQSQFFLAETRDGSTNSIYTLTKITRTTKIICIGDVLLCHPAKATSKLVIVYQKC